MPQLDKTTFLSQFFWLLFFYMGFYLVILKHFLPRLSRILKVRQKNVSLSQQGASALLQEREKVEGTLNRLVEQGCSHVKGAISRKFTGNTAMGEPGDHQFLIVRL